MYKLMQILTDRLFVYFTNRVFVTLIGTRLIYRVLLVAYLIGEGVDTIARLASLHAFIPRTLVHKMFYQSSLRFWVFFIINNLGCYRTLASGRIEQVASKLREI